MNYSKSWWRVWMKFFISFIWDSTLNSVLSYCFFRSFIDSSCSYLFFLFIKFILCRIILVALISCSCVILKSPSLLNISKSPFISCFNENISSLSITTFYSWPPGGKFFPYNRAFLSSSVLDSFLSRSSAILTSSSKV